MIAPLLGQDGEVAKSKMAVDPLVHAAELLRSLQGEDSKLARLGLGGLA
jgi:hypothetical protein